MKLTLASVSAIETMMESAASLETVGQCVLCGEKNAGRFALYGLKSGYRIVRCANCGLIFVNPRDSSEKIYQQYKENITSPILYYQTTAETDAVNFRARLEWIERRLRGTRKGKLLDIGCSVGTFLEVARERGWEVSGIEGNQEACSLCRGKNLRVHAGLFDSEFVNRADEKDFDLVCMNDSIEHFPDPCESLRLAATLLKPNGLISVSTPNIANIMARVFQVKPKEHLFYFSKETLSRALADAGFKVDFMIETGRKRDVGAMHLGATFENPVWPILTRGLKVSGLAPVVGLVLEKCFKDELFALGRKG